MRVAIVGASGLIGSAIWNELSADNEVLSVGRRERSDFKADLSEPTQISRLDFEGIDAIVHCAGIVDEDFSVDPQRAFNQATVGASALVDRAVQGKVRKFAYISSAHVYGLLEGDLTEDAPPNPLSDYAIAHFATEQILRRSQAKIETGIFRPCAVYGTPSDFGEFRRWGLIPFAFPRSALYENAIVLKSNGLQRRNFIAAGDIARSISSWLDSTLATSQPFNLVGKATLSVWEFAQMCAKIAEQLTSSRCTLERQLTASREAPKFRYDARMPFCYGDTDLESEISALMSKLLAMREADAGMTRL